MNDPTQQPHQQLLTPPQQPGHQQRHANDRQQEQQQQQLEEAEQQQLEEAEQQQQKSEEEQQQGHPQAAATAATQPPSSRQHQHRQEHRQQQQDEQRPGVAADADAQAPSSLNQQQPRQRQRQRHCRQQQEWLLWLPGTADGLIWQHLPSPADRRQLLCACRELRRCFVPFATSLTASPGSFKAALAEARGAGSRLTHIKLRTTQAGCSIVVEESMIAETAAAAPRLVQLIVESPHEQRDVDSDTYSCSRLDGPNSLQPLTGCPDLRDLQMHGLSGQCISSTLAEFVALTQLTSLSLTFNHPPSPTWHWKPSQDVRLDALTAMTQLQHLHVHANGRMHFMRAQTLLPLLSSLRQLRSLGLGVICDWPEEAQLSSLASTLTAMTELCLPDLTADRYVPHQLARLPSLQSLTLGNMDVDEELNEVEVPWRSLNLRYHRMDELGLLPLQSLQALKIEVLEVYLPPALEGEGPDAPAERFAGMVALAQECLDVVPTVTFERLQIDHQSASVQLPADMVRMLARLARHANMLDLSPPLHLSKCESQAERTATVHAICGAFGHVRELMLSPTCVQWEELRFLLDNLPHLERVHAGVDMHKNREHAVDMWARAQGHRPGVEMVQSSFYSGHW